MARVRLLLTGASGRIGQTLLGPFRERFEVRTFDRRPVPGDPNGVIGDLHDYAALRTAMEGMDVLVHLAANPSGSAPFLEELVPSNIVGVYNAFESAREAGVRRVIFASTGQTVMSYPEDHTVELSDPVRPVSIYGATKVFGEVLGRYYHDHHGLEFVAVRIGSFLPKDSPQLRGSAHSRLVWFSPGDAVRLFLRAVEKPDVGYAVVFGTSITEREHLSRRPARELLDYEPVDDVNKLNGK